MSAGTATRDIRREKHGHKKHQLQGRIRQLKDAFNVALRFCPKNVREATAPLLKGSKPPEAEAPEVVDVELILKTNMVLQFYKNLHAKGFLGRIAWAIGYVFTGITGGAE